MSNLLRVELYKLIRNKIYWVLVTVLSGLAFLLVLLAYLDQRGVLDHVEQISVEFSEDVLLFTGISMMIDSIHSPDLFLSVLMISIFGAFFISTEYSNGTIKNLVASGYHRWQIYLAKMIVFSIGSIFLVFFMAFILGTFGAIFFEIGEWPSSEIMVKTGKMIVVSMLLLLGFSSIVMLFAMMARGSGVSILLSLGFYFLAGAGLRMIGYKYTIGETLNTYSVYYRYSTLPKNSLDISNIVELSLIAVITSVVFIVIGAFIFQRKDIS